jgi:hypothetical protein
VCRRWPSDARHGDRYAVITNAAVYAGVSVQDIKPGGKYFDTFADMLAGMKKGTETESSEEACTTAKKNYGEAAQ